MHQPLNPPHRCASRFKEAHRMRPHVICHMLSSVDGKIDWRRIRAALRAKASTEGPAGGLLGGDAWICGRTTHAAALRRRTSRSSRFRTLWRVRSPLRRSEGGLVQRHLCRHGFESFSGVTVISDGDHLICVVSERASAEYLAILREKGHLLRRRGANVGRSRRCPSAAHRALWDSHAAPQRWRPH